MKIYRIQTVKATADLIALIRKKYSKDIDTIKCIDANKGFYEFHLTYEQYGRMLIRVLKTTLTLNKKSNMTHERAMGHAIHQTFFFVNPEETMILHTLYSFPVK